jgi:predicted HAD superfamily Cof-like phosphohydrolase
MRYLNHAGTLGPALLRVKRFHELARFEVGDEPRLLEGPTLDLAIEIIREEFEELVRAVTGRRASVAIDYGAGDSKPNVTATAHELTDLVYVVLGFAVRSGIDLSPLFDAVCDANDAKVYPEPRYREDGKLLKPDGWKSAKDDVCARLAHQMKLAAILRRTGAAKS